MNLSRKIFSYITAGLLLLMAGKGYAQSSARAFTDGRKILIGDQVKLWLEVKPTDKTDKISWAAIPDTLNGLEIVEKGKIDTLRNADTFLLRQRLLVTGFDSGSYYIPSFSFGVTHNGSTDTLHTDSILIQVQTIPVDTTKAFKPIKEIVPVKWSIWDYWLVIVAALVLIGFGIFVWIYFYKNKGTKVPAGQKVPPEKAHEKALRLLQELKEKQLWEQGQSKAYFSELSDIVRIYLEERFGIPAMEQTTDELLALLKKQHDARAELRKLRPELKLILRTADLAKFAKASPLPQEHSACMEAAVAVVQQTKVQPGEGAAS